MAGRSQPNNFYNQLCNLRILSQVPHPEMLNPQYQVRSYVYLAIFEFVCPSVQLCVHVLCVITMVTVY